MTVTRFGARPLGTRWPSTTFVLIGVKSRDGAIRISLPWSNVGLTIEIDDVHDMPLVTDAIHDRDFEVDRIVFHEAQNALEITFHATQSASPASGGAVLLSDRTCPKLRDSRHGEGWPV